MFTLATLIFLLPFTAGANDSSATLAAGGLVLTQNAAVVMAAEDLSISPDRIDIRYVFENRSDEPVSTLVSFPLPRIDLAYYANSPIDIPSTDPVNFVDFTVSVNGAKVTPKVQQKAFLGGIDVTDKVTAAGLPISSLDPSFQPALAAMPADAVKALIASGLVEGDPAEPVTLFALWSLDVQFYWPMTFPPHTPVAVEHAYKPVSGAQLVTTDRIDGAGRDDLSKPYCIDGGTRRAMLKGFPKPTPDNEMPLRSARFIDYILVTAKNWQGSIEKFHLTIDKGEPGAILSLCLDGITKTGPTRFEFTATDYVPDSDLKLMILR